VTINISAIYGQITLGNSISCPHPRAFDAANLAIVADFTTVFCFHRRIRTLIPEILAIKCRRRQYRSALDTRASLSDAQAKVHTEFDMAHDEFLGGAVGNLDVLTTEQTLVAVDSAVVAADAALVQGQITLFKALGGGWRGKGEEGPGQ
jgi:hypothetical protein